MKQKQIILFASIFVVICATKEETAGNVYGGPADTIGDTIYGHQLQDNIAAESEISKRGTAVPASASAVSSESDSQNSQIYYGNLEWWMLFYSVFVEVLKHFFSQLLSFKWLGTSGSGSGSVIGYSSPNSFQQFYSPTFGQFGSFYAASPVQSTTSGTSPQVKIFPFRYRILCVCALTRTIFKMSSVMRLISNRIPFRYITPLRNQLQFELISVIAIVRSILYRIIHRWMLCGAVQFKLHLLTEIRTGNKMKRNTI